MIINILLIIIIYGLLILILGINFDTDSADFLIVLGHKLNKDKIDDVLKYRLDKTIKYSKNNPNTKIVLTGGITKNNTLSEAYVMQEYLIKNGIDSSLIILEDKAKDTIENIHNSLDYIDSNSKTIVLSSNYHVFRAKVICYLLGLKVKTIGVYTPMIQLILHLPIEEIFIFIHSYRIKKQDF